MATPLPSKSVPGLALPKQQPRPTAPSATQLVQMAQGQGFQGPRPATQTVEIAPGLFQQGGTGQITGQVGAPPRPAAQPAAPRVTPMQPPQAATTQPMVATPPTAPPPANPPIAPLAGGPQIAPPSGEPMPTPPIAPLAPQTPGTPIDPNASLVGQAFLPGDTSFDPATQQARDLVSQQLQGLQGPDRGELAMRAFERFQEASQPQFESRLRDVGRRAAALGRVGAGMTTSELGDVQLQRERELMRLQQGLADQAAGLTLQDRLGALQGGLGGLGGLAGLDEQGFLRGVQQRGELRGERGFQRGLAEQAQATRIAQENAEFARQQQEVQNRLAEQQMLAGLAGTQPFSPFAGLQGANIMQPQSSTADFFSMLGQQGGGAAPPPVPGLTGSPLAATVPGIFQGQGLGMQRPGATVPGSVFGSGSIFG